MSQNDCIGKTLKPWPILVDHYSLDKLSQTICNESGFIVGQFFSLADIFVASIYKKALQHGYGESEFYNNHLIYIRKNGRVAVSEPQT